MSQPVLKYFFGALLWAAAGLFAATSLGIVSLGTESLALALGALVLVCIAGAWFMERIDLRLRVLARAAQDFASGAARPPLQSPRGDEIGALTDAFNKMARATEQRIEHLQASLQQQRFIAEQSPDASWVFDVGEFRLVDVNENFVKLSGYPRTELIGRTPMDVSPPVQAGGIGTETYARSLIERTLRGETVVAPWVIRTRHGEDVTCELRAVHVPSATRTLLCGSLMDVRDRLRTEQALAQRLRFEVMITQLSSRMAGIASDRMDAAIRQALADVGEFAGVDRSYLFLFDESGTRVTCTHEWCEAGIEPQIARLADLEVSAFPWVESRLQRGETVHVPCVDDLPEPAHAERSEWMAESIKSILLVPVLAAGRVRGYVGFDAVRGEKRWAPEYLDVLKVFGEIVLNAVVRVQAELALRQQNEMLAKTVAELERSNDELQQFAYIASHDLQEPLRSIGGFSELLRKHYGAQLDERGAGYLEFVNSAAKRLHHLIAGLLDYTRVGARARPFESCTLGVVLELALANLSASIQDSGATVTHDPLPAVPGDAAQLTVLLQNLIGNALKFHGESAPRVHVGARLLPGGGYEISVRDNGIGIAPADTRKLFQIFRRLNPADKYPGTGIGLAVCKRIVQHHQGRIWVEPNADAEGCTFRFTLPELGTAVAAA